MKQSTIQFYLALLFLLICSMAKAEDVKVTLKADMLVSDETLCSAIDLADKTDVNLIFSLDEGLTNLNDEQILRISQFAKNNWEKIAGVDFSSITSLTTLPNGTFNGADRLTSIKLPALTKLSANLFTNCSSLTSLTIGDWSNTEGNEGLEMAEIPAGCFQGCGNLTNLYFKGIKNIQGWAFSGCTSMTELPIKSMATDAKVSLGSNAFENTKFTGDLVLPEGIAYVGGNCFGSCLQLKSITFPSTIEKIDATFDNNCTALTHINVEENNYYEAINGILYQKKDENLILTRCPIANPEPIVIPSNKNVTEIAKQAFLGCSMTSITLNEGLLKIGDNAFGNCKNLESLTIPASTSDIASSFVNGCEKLATLTITAGNEKYETIDNITYAKNSVIEDNVEKETKVIFRVPEAYTCTDGKLDISAVEGVTQVGNNAFEDCINIKELKLPDNLSAMGDECFKNSGIETFYVPKHLTVEGYGLVPFSGCNSLRAFAGKDLDNFTVDERGILYNKENTKLFKVPNNYQTINADGSFDIRHHIKEVQACAFEGAQRIKKVVFAQGIKELPHRCFLNAKVEKVVIPNSITTIGQDAFMGSEVKEVIMLTTTQNAPQSQNSNFNSFYGINGNLRIHLSENSAYGNFKDAWVKASEEFKSASNVPKLDDGETQEEKDGRNYGWYGLNQANRLVEDVKHRAIFENSKNIAGFNAEGEHNILNEKDASNNLSAQHYDYITLYRDFSSMSDDEYATLALPVDITKATLKAAFGSNTKIWKFIGRKDKVICFESVDFNASSVADNEIIIKKGVAVLIQPEYKENSYLLQMNLGGESTDVNAIALNEGTQTSYDTEDKEIVTTTGNINIVNGVRQENVTFDYGFYATYQKKSFMEKGSYYMKTDGSFVYAVNSLWTKAFRGFIHGNDEAIGGDVSAPAKLSFDGFTTSIDDVNIDGNAYKSYDIYNTNGQLVRKNATSTDGLSKGLYIMNGKKVIVK